MIVCLTAEDRAFLKACGIAQDGPWFVSECHCEIHRAEAQRAQRREQISDPLEEAKLGDSDPEAAQ